MLQQLNGETCLYPILGDPINFVKAPFRLTTTFLEHGHNGICIPMRVPEGELERVLLGLTAVPNILGLPITMPHKNTMFDLCATTSETARTLRVVNLARRNLDGSWHGDMLDGLAFVAAQRKQGANFVGSRVLQVGAGAVGSAIALAMLDAGVKDLVLHDVNQARLTELVTFYRLWIGVL